MLMVMVCTWLSRLPLPPLLSLLLLLLLLPLLPLLLRAPVLSYNLM